LNSGTKSNSELYLAYKKDPNENPIVDIVVVFPTSSDPTKDFPKGYTPIDIDINLGNQNAKKIFLAFKRASSQSKEETKESSTSQTKESTKEPPKEVKEPSNEIKETTKESSSTQPKESPIEIKKIR